MKLKTVSLLLFAAIMAVSVSACNNQSEKKENKSESKSLEVFDSTKVHHITKADFLKKVFNYEENTDLKYLGDKPCIVDFYATWCGPCKMVSPILDQLAKEYAGKIYIYKVDTDKERELAAAFAIRSIPSLLFVPMGEQPQMAQGAMDIEQFRKAIEAVLLKKE